MPARSKILCVLGTRPEAIKLAPVIAELRRRPDRFETLVCTTGQHREMVDAVLRVFSTRVDHRLDLSGAASTPSRMAAEILVRLEPVLISSRPDCVLVQGDTTTVAAAAWAAFHQRIRVGHVEAGLRTHDRAQPFPEEINRQIASVIADLHFAPTPLARQNLLREGISPERIFVTGNPVIDALQWAAARAGSAGVADAILSNLSPDTRVVLVTAHRRENHGPALERICTAIRKLAALEGGRTRFVFPVHPNPNVDGPVRQWLSGVSHVDLLPPLDYLPWVALVKRAHLILTDSGGLQEEAPGLGVPVLVLRERTERPEAVEAGTVRLIGTDTDRIVGEATRLLNDPEARARMARASNPFGDGHAAGRIVDALDSFLGPPRSRKAGTPTGLCDGSWNPEPSGGPILARSRIPTEVPHD